MNNEKTTTEGAGPFMECYDKIFHLEKGFNLIGSQKQSNHFPWIIIEDKNLDTKHAAIKYDDSFQIIDLGSTNGTFVNNVQISPFEWFDLNSNTNLRFGQLKVTVNKNQRLNDDSGLCNHNSSSTKDISMENTSFAQSPKSSTPTFPEKIKDFLVPSTQRELSKSIDDLMFNEDEDEDITIPETQQDDEYITFSSDEINCEEDVHEDSQSIFKCLNDVEDTDSEIELQTNNFKLKSPISSSNKENRTDDVEATQMFIPIKNHRLLNDSTENSLCVPTDEDFLDELDNLTQMIEEKSDFLAPFQMSRHSLKKAEIAGKTDDDSLPPTQMFRPALDKSEDLEETQIFDPKGKNDEFLAPTQMFRPSTKSKKPQVDGDSLLPTQMFRPSLDRTEDLEETQIFDPKGKVDPPRTSPQKDDVYMAQTQQIVLKRPEVIRTEDDVYFEATQKIDLSRKSRIDSPDLFEGDDDYCLAETQILESSKKEKKKINRVLVSSSESDSDHEIPTSSKKILDKKKLFSDSESEEDEEKPKKSIFDKLKKTEKTPAKFVKITAGCSSSSKKYRKESFCTPEQDFLLPKADELSMAEQFFRNICRESLKEAGNDSDNSDKDDSEKPIHELDDLDIITNEPADQIRRTTRVRSANKKFVETPKAVQPKKIYLRTRSASKGSVSATTEEASARKTRSESKKKEKIAPIAEEAGTSTRKQTPKKKEVPSDKKSVPKKKDDKVASNVHEAVETVKNVKSAKKTEKVEVPLKRSTRRNKNDKEIAPEILSASIKSPEFPVVESNNKVLRVRLDKTAAAEGTSMKRTLDSSTECESNAKKSKQSDSIVSETSSEKIRSTRLKPKILVTRYEITDRQIAIIKKLGGSIVERTEQADILLTEKVYRTWKFLSSLARGIPIVSPKWMEMVESKNKFYEYEKYLLSDPSGESRLNFNLKESLKIASEKLLYVGFTIYVTPKTLPTYAELSTIIKCAGGKCVDNIAELPVDDEKVFVISSLADKKLLPKIKAKFPKTLIVGTEGFMISILKQKIEFPQNCVIG